MSLVQHANPGCSKQPFSRAFRIYPTYPPLWDSQRAQMRQERHQPLKTLRVGMKSGVPERYGHPPLSMLVSVALHFAMSLMPFGEGQCGRSPPLAVHLRKIFFSAFGANVLCFPQGHVQGVSQLFALNSMSLKMDCHKLILSYCGHIFCHKFIALSLPCTVTFVDKQEGEPSMGFCFAKRNFRCFWRRICLGVLLASRRVNPPPYLALAPAATFYHTCRHLPWQLLAPSMPPTPPLLRSNACVTPANPPPPLPGTAPGRPPAPTTNSPPTPDPQSSSTPFGVYIQPGLPPWLNRFPGADSCRMVWMR